MIGNGMAGVACLDAVLSRGSGWSPTVIGEEPQPGYNRILLSGVLAGEHEPGDVVTHDWSWYAERGIELRAGVRAVAIDRSRRVVVDDAGLETPYDRLILATGSRPWIPPIEGAERDGVYAFRDLADVAAILEACRTARRAVVIGGGLLGLEAARGIARRKVETTVVHLMPWLMEQQLDAAASALLREAMRSFGIRVLLERRTLRFDGVGEAVERVVLDGDETLEADFVVVATGIRPRIELARAAGLDTRRGVVVDDALRTRDPSIYAVGECVEHRGRTYGLVAPLYEQGLALARSIHGDGSQPYLGSLPFAKLKVAGIDLLSVGAFAAERSRPEVETLRVEDPGAGLYRKILLEGGRVIGGILLGNADDGSRLVSLAVRATEVGSAERRALLLGSLADGAVARAAAAEDAEVAALPADATVCGCMGVSRGAIEAAIGAGATSLAAIAETTRASSSCGSCAGACRALLRIAGADAGPAGPRVLCECVPHPKATLRRMIKTQRLKSVSQVLDVYGDGEGCERCRPALAFLVDEVWQGSHREERRSRFINDRVHANIQNDGTFSVVPRIRGGVTSAAELRRIADVADRYGVPMLKITGGQRIDLLGVRKDQLPDVWRDLGMPSGHAYAKAVRTVKTCVGTEFCRFGVGDSTALGIELEASTERLYTPHKVKMGVTGCPRNCAEVTVKDIGIMAIQDGWEVHVGGASGMRVRKADLLARVASADGALRAAHLFLQYYRENGEYLERTYDFVERLGIDRVRAETVGAPREAQEALLERMRRAREATRDPWEAEGGSEPGFRELPPVRVGE